MESIIGATFLLIVLIVWILPALTEMSCQMEKSTISSLQNQLQQCQSQLNTEVQKSNNALRELNECRNNLSKCQEESTYWYNTYHELKKECAAKEQPITEYYFIKVFSNEIILFEWLVINHIVMFALVLSVGISITVKLFEVEIRIELLNKKNQKKLVDPIKEYLAEHPHVPVVVMLIIIVIINLPH